ncbi:Small archaeal modifier protein 3 [uncultured archaeon]|nr:Small archaeal modifier protein 3 [uncultured archaeon]
MIVHIRPFANFRDILGDDLRVELEDGSTVKQLLDGLCASHQGMKSAIFDESGKVHEYVILMKNRKDVDSLEGLKTTLSEADEVAILPPIAGG